MSIKEAPGGRWSVFLGMDKWPVVGRWVRRDLQRFIDEQSGVGSERVQQGLPRPAEQVKKP